MGSNPTDTAIKRKSPSWGFSFYLDDVVGIWEELAQQATVPTDTAINIKPPLWGFYVYLDDVVGIWERIA